MDISKKPVARTSLPSFHLYVSKTTGAITRGKRSSVFSHERTILQQRFDERGWHLNQRQKMNGLNLLKKLGDNSVPLVFFDPQYRSVLDKLRYGNEGKGRQKARSQLPQMSEEIMNAFIRQMDRVLLPSGHLLLWLDKYMVCNSLKTLLDGCSLQTVDLITWNKGRMGMGCRTRHSCEYLVVLQKPPFRAKGVWTVHDIPDVWTEKIKKENKNHVHTKPLELQKRLIEALTNLGDVVVDPASGGYSVLQACREANRNFLGCDLLG